MKDRSQSHTATKQRLMYMPTVKRIADAYSVAINDLLGECRTTEAANARFALVNALRGQGLTYAAIGEIVNREQTSVRKILRRKAGAANKIPKNRDLISSRSETERMFNDMCRRGSAALLLALFKTGKAYRPMTLAEQAEAIDWAKAAKPLRKIGWMR